MALTATLTANRWRYRPGDEVFARCWSADESGKVTGTVPGPFPAYYVVDPDGNEWRIAQIRLSRRPIPDAS
jgi:hypothetical protein